MKLTTVSKEEEASSLNPLFVFLALFILPYLFFLLLLMGITGQTDVNLLIESVLKDNNAVLIKTWVIGSFVLSIIGTVIISGLGAKRYIEDNYLTTERLGGGSVLSENQAPFVIETDQNFDTQLPVESDPELNEATLRSA